MSARRRWECDHGPPKGAEVQQQVIQFLKSAGCRVTARRVVSSRRPARQRGRKGVRVMSKQVHITAFTDPACTWCWGSEPILRALETRLGDQVRIRSVMGGLVKDIRAFMDTANGIGGDPERSNARVAAHWLEASERNGMPVKAEGFRLFTDQDNSTWPICEAYEAARLQGEAVGGRYLRRLREATASEARWTNRIEVQAE